jgi:SAM-dependent methyltransferase
VARKRVGGWRYEQNPDSGLEIWLGQRGSSPVSSDAKDDLGMVEEDSLSSVEERLVEHYFGGSDFRLCGYWSSGVRNPRAACENLMEEVLSLLEDHSGSMLDLGCGLGATTGYLLKYFESGRLLGLTQSKKWLRRCSHNAPGVRFKTMKPPRLRLPADSFSKVLCVEGERLSGSTALWSEIHRVLSPGGQVVGSELLFLDEDRDGPNVATGGPAEGPIEAYRHRLLEMGFSRVVVVDGTGPCWGGFSLHRSQHLTTRLRALAADDGLVHQVLAKLPGGERPVERYVLFSAFKGNG